MWLPWDYAAVIAAVLAVAAFATHHSPEPRARRSAPVLRELTILFTLYALWQLAGRLSVLKIDGAIDAGRWIWEFQQRIGLPDEAAWQAAVLDHPIIVQAANIYYGGAHVPAMGVFLVWLFFRHREHYARWRTTLALLTAGCLLIQLYPVAPPRFLPDLGFVDTGELYGQSVYASFGSTVAGQLQAMPSLHAGWAILIAWAAIEVSPHRWRWATLLHPVLTLLVIVVTGNHFWLDAIAALAVMLVAMGGQRIARRWRRSAADELEDPARAVLDHQNPISVDG